MPRTLDRFLAAALAAVLSAPALGAPPGAPASPGPPAEREGAGRAEEGAGALSAGQRAALAAVHASNALAIQVGELAGLRGAAPEIRNLGRLLALDHRRIQDELGRVLRARGQDPAALAAPERRRAEDEMDALALRTGEEFDRELVAFLRRSGPSFLEALAGAREAAAADAELVAVLRDAEEVERRHLSAARQVRAQRQARKPPRP